MRAEVQSVRASFQEENERLRAELRLSEAQRDEMRVELDNERSSSRRHSNHGSLTIEDLQRRLEAMTKERDMLSNDYMHLKKANSQREQESQTLRTMIEEERKASSRQMEILKSERDTMKADIDATRARARLDKDEQLLR